jgi:hypothetical protein
MAGFIEDFDYRDLEVKTLKDAMRYGPAQFLEDWNTAIACSQLLSEPGHESLEIVLERCMQRVDAWSQVYPEEAMSLLKRETLPG